MSSDILNTPPPKPRGYTKRLSPDHRNLSCGQSVITDIETARCILAYHRSKGRATARRKIKGTDTHQVWVLAPDA